MKFLKTVLFTSILSLLFTACVFEIETSEKKNRLYTSAELIGKWNQVGGGELSKDQDFKIKSIQLVNDSVAEIKLVGTDGEKLIFGEWQNGYKKELKKLHLTFESDVMVTYNTDKNHSNVLMFRISQENNKKIMSSNDLKFEKEEK